jgi:hypothetical protein
VDGEEALDDVEPPTEGRISLVDLDGRKGDNDDLCRWGPSVSTELRSGSHGW